MRTLALDLSTTRIGWAVGEPGRLPDEAGVIVRPADIKGDAAVFEFVTKAILAVARRLDVKGAVFEELNVFSRKEDPSKNVVNANTLRALCGVRGAVVFALRSELFIDAIPLHASSCRSVAGVDLSRDTELPMKLRVKERLSELGLETTDDNLADAAVVLYAAGTLIGKAEASEPRMVW